MIKGRSHLAAPPRPCPGLGLLSALRRGLFGLIAVIGCLAAGAMTACESGPAPAPAGGLVGGRPAIEPVESVIALCPGSMVVVPVRVNGPIPHDGGVEVRFGNTPPTRGTLVWIGVQPGHDPATAPAAPFAAAWMGHGGVWSATPASRSTRPLSAGTWAVAAEVPADIDPGIRSARIGAWPAPVTVLPGSCLAGLFGVSVQRPPGISGEVAGVMRTSPWLIRTLDALVRTPTTRWRARLAWRLLDGDPGGPLPGGTFADPVIEALARQAEWRWSAALARLGSADPALASSLAWRLAAIADLGGGVAMPVWSADGASLTALGEDLLNPLLSDAEIAARARIWLAEQPDAIAWVVDDGGATDAVTGGLIATVAVTNLSDAPAVAWAAHERASRMGELMTVPARSTARASAAAPGRIQDGGATLNVAVGDFAATRPVQDAPATVSPPGLRIGPLLPDWSLSTWLASGIARDGTADAGVTLDDAWTTGALLYREGGRWMLYVECRRPAPGAPDPSLLAPPPARTGLELVPGLGQVRRPRGSGLEAGASDAAANGLSAGGLVGAEEELRVWLGPLWAPTALLRISPAGVMIDEIGGAADGLGVVRRGSGTPVEVRVEEGVWACWVPIPPRCMEGTGLLRLGVERTDARGVRTAWPRRMLPWQREPGRWAIDVSAWPELGS